MGVRQELAGQGDAGHVRVDSGGRGQRVTGATGRHGGRGGHRGRRQRQRSRVRPGVLRVSRGGEPTGGHGVRRRVGLGPRRRRQRARPVLAHTVQLEFQHQPVLR